MSYSIATIEGIAKTNKAKLAKAGIKTTAGLLKSCGDRKGRKAVAAEFKLKEKQLLKWANMADLMRISGVASQNAELLEKAGVDTVKVLRRRNAASLTAKLEEVNKKKKLAKVAPRLKQVEGWVEAAKALDPIVAH